MQQVFVVHKIGFQVFEALAMFDMRAAVYAAAPQRAAKSPSSVDRMEALLETIEIMGSPKAMKAIRDYQAGKIKFQHIDQLDEN
ncbi:MAG: hypothetical protein N2689_14565 [Verrucomicrobiae bacterium]|nr:hypothetical protein [Verrucomicrobiae bacterium]